jgi:hypothetical protein
MFKEILPVTSTTSFSELDDIFDLSNVFGLRQDLMYQG